MMVLCYDDHGYDHYKDNDEEEHVVMYQERGGNETTISTTN